MTRPGIIRADTIDLQDRTAPSAQDHSHAKAAATSQPPSTLSYLAPSYNNSHHISSHQSETIRGVVTESALDRRVSWSDANLSDYQIYNSDLAADIANSLSLQNDIQESTIEIAHHNMTTRKQQDALAIAQNGGASANDPDADLEAIDDELDDDDDMMDKISSSPSIEDEDIDFDFVYALHTFQATVEGQANATKGDTMVLLDDSNSYWWLVRVVKDSSIGYLPAEHIETPSERLARLNKHRNIDLSATMLGDQADKGKGSLMTAMRRRKAKTVAFAAPTYVDYHVDFSSDEEDLEAEFFAQQQSQQAQQRDKPKKDIQDSTQSASQSVVELDDDDDDDDESATVEPLKPRTSKESTHSGSTLEQGDGGDGGKDPTRSSEDIFVASKSETPGPKRARDGTVRDSFFKDDTVETKKITLTPNLLRDSSVARTSLETEAKQRASIDKLDKDINAMLVKDDKKKKDKKDKDKKQGGFRSLFSRGNKDKKRGDADDDESVEKRSMDTSGGYSEKDGEYDDMDEESAQHEKSGASRATTPTAAGGAATVTASPQAASSPQRNPSKLQKQQPSSRNPEASPTRKAQKDGTVRVVGFEPAEDQDHSPTGPSATMQKVSGILSNGATRNDSRSASRTASQAAAGEFDSDEEIEAPQRQAPASEQQQQQQQQQRSQAPPQQTPQQTSSDLNYDTGSQAPAAAASRSAPRTTERLSESPVQVSPVNANNPPALMVDSSSQGEDEEMDRSSPISSPSPELVESENRSGNRHYAEDSVTTSTSATTANTATWNDSSLRAFFDSGADVRDLLAVVYDKSDVEPVGPDHPVAGSLFKEQNAKLAEITTQLDNMLGDWLARKQRSRGGM